MYDCATKFLSTHVIVATTARQRLELALTATRLLERHPIDERRLSRLCAADCDLSAIIELHVDLDVFDNTSVPLHVLERLVERCRVPADTVLIETPARPDILSDPAEVFRGHRQHESTLQFLKRLKQGMPLAVNELWDAHNGNFVDATASMAKLIQDAAQDQQGRVTSSPLHGQNLLGQWRANFSQCRVSVERHEIANIMLDSPNGKKPVPDGLPAAFLKRYCHQLAIIFQETWIELAIWICTHCWKVAFDFSATQSALHIQKLCPSLGDLLGTSGTSQRMGWSPHCVVHYDTCPGVCLNFTDGSC